MSVLEQVMQDVQKASPAQLLEVQALLQKQKRQRLKAAAEALFTSTEEEERVFLENVARRPWSPRD
jgi:hypothetical protein